MYKIQFPAILTGYHCEFKRRTGLKPDGCAVVFKRERFSLVSCHPLEYFRRGIPLLDRDNIGLVLLLRPIDCNGSFANICVANTHLLYNPRRGDIKLAQLALLMAEISQVAKLPDGGVCPLVLCGDFNSVPWSPLYQFIKESRLEYDGMPIGKVVQSWNEKVFLYYIKCSKFTTILSFTPLTSLKLFGFAGFRTGGEPKRAAYTPRANLAKKSGHLSGLPV